MRKLSHRSTVLAADAIVCLIVVAGCETRAGWGRAEPLAIIPLSQGVTARRPGDLFSGSAPAFQLAVDDGGNALVVWRQSIGGADVDLSRRFRVGRGWEAPQTIQSGCVGCPALVLQADAAGNALVLWADSAAHATMFSQSSPASPWTPPRPVPEAVEMAAFDVYELAMNAGGDALLASLISTSFGPEVWTQAFANGAWGVPVRVGQGPAGTSREYVQLALNGRGQAALLWGTFRPVGRTGEVAAYAQQFEPGSGWTTPQQVGDFSIGAALARPGLDEEGNGWMWGLASPPGNIYIRRLLGGGPWSSPELVEGPDFDRPMLTLGRGGHALFLFHHRDSRLWSKVHLPSGGWRVTEPMSVGFLGDFAGSVAPDGRAHVVWTIRDGDRHVWTRRFDPPVGWATEEPIDRLDQPVRSCPDFDSGRHRFLGPQIGVDPSVDALAAWAETWCGDTTLWANHYQAAPR